MINKELWKRILSITEDEDLLLLAQITNIDVPGFRQINANNFKRAKKLFLNEALKPRNLKLVVHVINKNAEMEEDEEKQFRNKSFEELQQDTQNGVKPHQILAQLYSSEKSEHHQIAQKLEEHLQTQTIEIAEKDDTQMVEETIQSENKEAGEQQQTKSLERKIKKLEQRLSEANSKWSKFESQSKKLLDREKEEKKNLSRKINDLSSDLLEKEKRLQEHAILLRESQKQLEQKEKELAERNATIAHLNARILNISRQGDFVESNEDSHQPTSRNRIALIGNPKNKAIMKNPHFDIDVIEVADYEKVRDETEWNQYKEVWLIKYKVPVTKQAYIHHTIEKPLREINTFQDLKTLVERGL